MKCAWSGSPGPKISNSDVAAGRNPYDRELSDLVGELSTRSETFRTLWAAHNVRKHDTGVKGIHHPLVGDVTFAYEGMELAADPGLTLFVYTVEPGSKSEQALNLLASWVATEAGSRLTVTSPARTRAWRTRSARAGRTSTTGWSR